MTGTIASFTLTSLDPDETMSDYAGILPKDLINIESISQYQNFVNDYEGGVRLEHLPVTAREFDLDLDLQSLFSHLQFLQLNLMSLNKASKASKAFYKRIHKIQLQANK